MKKIIALLLVLSSVLLIGCGSREGEATEYGFIDEQTGIEYIDVKPLGLYAVNRGEEFLTVKVGEAEQQYFEVQFEDTKNFLCFEDSGEYLLVRAKDFEEPTLATFDPIAAFIYNDTNTVQITNFFADAEYLPEGSKYNNPTEDSDLCRMIASQLTTGEAVEVNSADILKDDMFFIRLLSQKYPGLYYLVVFYGATDGRYYLFDRAAGKTVLCPYDVIVRMVGE